MGSFCVKDTTAHTMSKATVNSYPVDGPFSFDEIEEKAPQRRNSGSNSSDNANDDNDDSRNAQTTTFFSIYQQPSFNSSHQRQWQYSSANAPPFFSITGAFVDDLTKVDQSSSSLSDGSKQQTTEAKHERDGPASDHPRLQRQQQSSSDDDVGLVSPLLSNRRLPPPPSPALPPVQNHYFPQQEVHGQREQVNMLFVQQQHHDSRVAAMLSLFQLLQQDALQHDDRHAQHFSHF